MNKTGIIALLMVFAVTACAGNGNKKKQAKPVTKQETKTAAAGEVIHLTKAEFLVKVANFEKNPNAWQYLGDKPCIIDFYATWCGPCRAVSPILEEMAREYAGKIYIYKIDVDRESELASAFGISSIPTMFFCPVQGQPQVTQGALPKESIKEAIEKVLLKK